MAGEMNLSETAFLVRREAGGFDLRWFTPAVEVDLCGHATLASAHVLWEEGHLPPDAPAVFHTRSGRLSAELRGGWIEMDFPAEQAEPAPAPEGLAAALGAEPTYVGRNRFDYLAEVGTQATAEQITPYYSRLAKIDTRGIIVTARTDTEGFDFVSRFFAPRTGINEDPVTGSAHCCLGPYWRRRLGRNMFTARQVSERGGLVKVAVRGERVTLSGQAVTVLRGELVADAVGRAHVLLTIDDYQKTMLGYCLSLESAVPYSAAGKRGDTARKCSRFP